MGHRQERPEAPPPPIATTSETARGHYSGRRSIRWMRILILKRSLCSDEGGKQPAAADEKPKPDQEAAVVVDAAAGTGAGDDDYDGKWVDTDFGDDVKRVEMPLDYIAWLLSRKREDYSFDVSAANLGRRTKDDELAEHRKLILKIHARHEAEKEEFFAFQEWIRDTFERNGRVMMPEHILPRNEELLKQVWEKAGLGVGDDD